MQPHTRTAPLPCTALIDSVYFSLRRHRRRTSHVNTSESREIGRRRRRCLCCASPRQPAGLLSRPAAGLRPAGRRHPYCNWSPASRAARLPLRRSAIRVKAPSALSPRLPMLHAPPCAAPRSAGRRRSTDRRLRGEAPRRAGSAEGTGRGVAGPSRGEAAAACASW